MKYRIDGELLFEIGYLLTRHYDVLDEAEPERFKKVFSAVSKKLAAISARECFCRACNRELPKAERDAAMTEYLQMKAAAETEIPP